MNWQLDFAHSRVGFKVRHLMVSNVRGQFEKVSGTFTFDPQNPLATQAEIHIAADSINTKDEQRDGHLKSADFLDSANHPEIVFRSSGVSASDEADEYILHGDLTIRGVTRPLDLKVELNGVNKSPWGQTVAGFEIEGEINRTDFGLNWNVALETGGILVGEKVKLDIQVELIQQ